MNKAHLNERDVDHIKDALECAVTHTISHSQLTQIQLVDLGMRPEVFDGVAAERAYRFYTALKKIMGGAIHVLPPAELDDCQICHGQRGGIKGNEIEVEDITMCDYCHSTQVELSKFYKMKRRSPEATMVRTNG